MIFWLTTVMILERMVANTTVITLKSTRRPTRIHSPFQSVLGITSSSAICVSFGPMRPAAEARRLMENARIIFHLYFLI